MNAIYKPKGKAAEYGKYAVNLYSGCIHGCKYCYVPRVLRMDRDDFHSGFKLREGILEQLDRDAAKHPKDKPVFLSFTSDPYQPGAEATTREALKILNSHGINFRILTKGGLRAVNDFDLYKSGDWFGETLVYKDSQGNEPLAASTDERMEALQFAKEEGISTWVSFEPVISENDTLYLLARVVRDKLADEVKIGACSGGHSLVTDWWEFYDVARRICENYNMKYYLKKDLLDLVKGK